MYVETFMAAKKFILDKFDNLAFLTNMKIKLTKSPCPTRKLRGNIKLIWKAFLLI